MCLHRDGGAGNHDSQWASWSLPCRGQAGAMRFVLYFCYIFHSSILSFNPAQYDDLFDLVPVRSMMSNNYFVNKHVVDMAHRNAKSYFDYARTIFDDFIAKDVALLCTWGDYNNDNLDDGHVRATLPAVPMDVFLGNICFFYFITFKIIIYN